MPYTSNPYVVAAICGNFFQESTVNPGIWENLRPNDPGYGLGQWTDNPPQVMRRTALFNWLTTNGYPQDSGQGQLEFLIYEDLWISQAVPAQSIPASLYANLTDYLNSSSTDLYSLVTEFQYHWEGINDGSTTTRYNFAYDLAYNIFPVDDGTRNPWFSGNYYLNLTEARSNAMLIKDFLMGSPTPPTPPTPPTDEEIFAFFKHAMDLKRRGGSFRIVF